MYELLFSPIDGRPTYDENAISLFAASVPVLEQMAKCGYCCMANFSLNGEIPISNGNFPSKLIRLICAIWNFLALVAHSQEHGRCNIPL